MWKIMTWKASYYSNYFEDRVLLYSENILSVNMNIKRKLDCNLNNFK